MVDKNTFKTYYFVLIQRDVSDFSDVLTTFFYSREKESDEAISNEGPSC